MFCLIFLLGSKVASDTCFFRNTFGKNDSHCGKTKDGYRACTKEYVIFYNFLCKIAHKMTFPASVFVAPGVVQTVDFDMIYFFPYIEACFVERYFVMEETNILLPVRKLS